MPMHVICLYMALIMYCSVKMLVNLIMLNVVYVILKYDLYIFINMINNELFLRNFGGIENNSLDYILKMDMNDEDGELDIFHQSPYFDDDDLINHIKNKEDKFIVLSLNCQSLNAKIDEIIIKLDILRNNGCEISALCLQETWLMDDSDTSLLQIDGYTLISQGKICSSHADLAIYLSNIYNYKCLDIYKKSNIWEGKFIEVTSNTINIKIVLGNLRPPRDIICFSAATWIVLPIHCSRYNLKE